MADDTVQAYGNFIDGRWLPPSTGRWYEIHNPADTSQVLGRFPLSDATDVDAAVAAARRAFETWRETPAPRRGELMFRFADALMAHQEELARILTLEEGKPIGEARSEVERAAREARYTAGEATRLAGSTLPSERQGVLCLTVRQPLGVVAAITPWNFPVVSPVRKIVPALVAGNTVVFKPASATPWTAVRLTQLMEAVGLPAGVLNLVIGRGAAIGDRLVDAPDVRGISFTGSTDVGARLYERAARRLARVQLELGGKNPAVVYDYPDLEEAAAQIVNAAFLSSGQRCTALSRVIVSRQEADALVARLAERIRALQVGPGLDPSTTMGPLVSADQLERVERYVEQALAQGAVAVVGGRRLRGGIYDRGYYFEPTLLDRVDPASTAAQEEIFGPVLAVIRVGSFDEALAVANSVRYGLAASVFTRDMALAYRFAQRAEAGMVHVNHGTSSEPHVPFGGVKASGVGPFSIGETNKDFFTELKVVYWKGT